MIPSVHLSRERAGMNGIFDLSLVKNISLVKRFQFFDHEKEPSVPPRWVLVSSTPSSQASTDSVEQFPHTKRSVIHYGTAKASAIT